MPWITSTPMSQRFEFVVLASQVGTNFRQLCRRFGISPKTGYKWCARYATGGAAALVNQSRRPKRSPGSCGEAMAAKVVALRREHPTWGGRKLRRRLQDLAVARVPAASTCALRLYAGLSCFQRELRPRPGSASSGQRPTNFGRWTSRDTSRPKPEAAVTR